MGYKGKRWKVKGTKRGREAVRERVNESERERQCERSKPESTENENSVKETAETSPDVSLHTLSGSITHGNPRGKQNPQTHRQYKDMLIINFGSRDYHQ